LKSSFEDYRCPDCSGSLDFRSNHLRCSKCGHRSSIRDGYVDFVGDRSDYTTTWTVKTLFEVIPPIYQSIYFPFFYRIGTFPKSHSPGTLVDHIVDRSGNGDGRVLDLACGTGLLTRSLAERNRITYGVDLSAGMIEQALSVGNDVTPDKLRYARADAERLPFPDDFFNTVTCSGAFYFFTDLESVLRQVGRVIVDGGRLAGMTVVNNGLFRFSLSKVLLDLYQSFQTFNVYEVNELRTLLERAGFGEFRYQLYGCVIIFDATYRIG